MTTTPTKEYFTLKELSERWQVPEYNLKRLIPPVIIDGNVRYSLSDVIRFEKEGLSTEEEVAKDWDVTLDEIKNINEIFDRFTVDGKICYRNDDLSIYERVAQLYMEKSPKFMFKKDEGKES